MIKKKTLLKIFFLLFGALFITTGVVIDNWADTIIGIPSYWFIIVAGIIMVYHSIIFSKRSWLFLLSIYILTYCLIFVGDIALKIKYMDHVNTELSHVIYSIFIYLLVFLSGFVFLLYIKPETESKDIKSKE